MNIEQVIAQLESLREHCMSKVHDDEPESVWLSDVAALNYAITEVKRLLVKHFCDRYLKCEDCPLNEKDVRCSYFPWADTNELDTILQAIRQQAEEEKHDAKGISRADKKTQNPD